VAGHNDPVVTAALALPRQHPPQDTGQLQRCLLLAALLHVWLVLVFGNAAGTAAPGQGVWGSLTVKLMGRSGDTAGAPPGEKASSETAPPREAGAANPGRWNPREVPAEAARTDETSPAPPSTATLQLPEGFQPLEREKLDTPPPSRLAPTESSVVPMTPAEALRSTAPTPLQAPAAELPPTVGRLETRPEAAPAPLPSPAELRPRSSVQEPSTLPTTELPAPVRRLEAAPQGGATSLPRPAELRMASPATPAVAPTAELPAPVRRLEAVPEASSVAALPRPAELRAPGAVEPVATPSTELPAAVRRLEAPAAETAVTSTLPRATELRPSATAPAAQAPTARDLPAPVRRLEAAEGGAAAPVTPLQRANDTRPAPAAAAANALPELSTALPGQVTGPGQGNPAADAFAAPKASPGSPDAGPQVGQPIGPNLPAPPTAAASAPRTPLNLSLPRGDASAKRGSGLVDLLPPPPERKSKLEQSLEDAANKDCRKAYAGAGILAAVPLAIDAVRGKGCKW
jgi:Meckel syndrome type 1 protein